MHIRKMSITMINDSESSLMNFVEVRDNASYT